MDRYALRLGITLAVTLVLGCSKGVVAPEPVDPAQAREALKTALDTWKKGKKPSDLTSATPPITAQDPDWDAKRTLVDYQVTGEGKDLGAVLQVPVKLKLRGPGGKPVEKDTSYRVGTSPTPSVFRDLF